jgi:ankyrin repeat protein
MVEFLIANGAKVNARANNGQTPLHKAANGGDRKDNTPGPGHLAAATALLKHGADPRAKDDSGQSPLDLAGTEKMKALLANQR